MMRPIFATALAAVLSLAAASAPARDLVPVDYRVEADSLTRYRETFAGIVQDRQLSDSDRLAAQAVLDAAELCYEGVYALSQMKKLDACLSQETRSTMGQVCFGYEYRVKDLLLAKKDAIDVALLRAGNARLIDVGGQLSGYLSRIADQIKRWLNRRKY